MSHTDLPHARGLGHGAAPDGRDHMGRRPAATVGEAFAQDWPWILGVVGLICFLGAALSGVLR